MRQDFGQGILMISLHATPPLTMGDSRLFARGEKTCFLTFSLIMIIINMRTMISTN